MKKYALIAVIVAVIVFAILFLRKKIMNRMLSEILQKYSTSINAAGTRYQIPFLRIAAIIATESSGNPNAKNTGSTATGLMQITQAALTDYNAVYNSSFTLDDLLTPEININIGTWYLRNLINRNNFDLDTATRAYNQGAGMVSRTPNAGDDYLTTVKSYEGKFYV